MIPNVYLIGAPKCGTTALSTYLAEHPQGFLGYPKEPSYWSSDFAQSGAVARVDTEDAYCAIYRSAGQARAVVDASTRYLFSKVAVPRILVAKPRAKFIVILRNPVLMAQAYHMEKVFNLAETVTDFPKAWALQAARAEGRDLPPNCPEPNELQYSKVAALGSQLQRVMSQVPGDQLLVLFQEDLQKDPRRLWLRLQHFLELDDDGRQNFPIIGRAHHNRFPTLARIYQSPGPVLGPVVRWGKRILRQRGQSPVTDGVKNFLVSFRSRDPLPAAFEAELTAHFAPEVRLLAELTGRNLNHWLPPSESQE